MAVAGRMAVTAVRPLLVAAVSSLALIGPALAQAEPIGESAETPKDDIVIFGTRFAEGFEAREAATGLLGNRPLLDTPYGVNLISEAILQAQLARSIYDIARNDPSSSLVNANNGTGGYDTVAIRGIRVGSYNGVRANGLPVGEISAVNAQFLDRTEIYKGATGLFFGFVPPGGVVNYVTKRPPEQGTYMALIGTYDQDSVFGLYGDIGTRIGDENSLGFRLNAGFREGDSFIEGIREQSRAISAVADAKLGDALTVTLELENVKFSPRGTQLLPFSDGVTVPDVIDPRRLFGQPWTDRGVENTRLAGFVDWNFATNWTLQVAGQWLQTDRADTFLFAPIEADQSFDLTYFYDTMDRIRTNYGHIRVRGEVMTGSIRHELSIEAVQFTGDDFRGDYSNTPDGGAVFLGRSSLLNPVIFPDPQVPQGPVPRVLDTSFRERSIAVANAMSFGDSVQAIVGARYVDYELSRESDLGLPLDKLNDESRLSPSVALLFKPTPKTTVYASYSEALEAGGQASFPAVNEGDVLAPIVTRLVEVGVKAQLGRGLLTAAMFRLSRPLEFLNQDLVYVQDGKQRNQGFELTYAGRVANRFDLIGGVMYLDAKIREIGDPALNGNRTENTPSWRGSMFGQYDVTADGALKVNAGLYYTSRLAVTDANQAFLPAFLTVNTGANWAFNIGSQKLKATVAVENLFDKRYWAASIFGFLVVGEPRTVRGTLEWRF